MKFHHCTIIWLFLGLPAVLAAEKKPPIAAEIIATAERGEAEAQFQMARAYLRGEGVPKDVKKAFEWMKIAADQGNAEAIGGLGYFYSTGIAVPKDEKLAMEWFRKGAEKGSAKAQLNLGKLLIKRKVATDEPEEKLREEGIQWIMKAADQGLAEAALSYGHYLYFGDNGLAKDYGRAAQYFKIAADQNDPEAQNFLGLMSEYGWGVTLNDNTAADWFRKAALQGLVKAQANLGRKMDPSSPDKKQRIESIAWLLLASSQGEVTAEKSIAEASPGFAPDDMEEAKIKLTELRKHISKNSDGSR